MDARWHIVTGEFPPDSGGVADYTFQVAKGLHSRDYPVSIFTRRITTNAPSPTESLESSQFQVHRLRNAFGRSGLKEISEQLGEAPAPRRLLVQYVPHAFGAKGMNLRFANWVRQRGLDDDTLLTLMFHEVAFPWVRRPIHHNLIASANRWMVRRMLPPAKRVMVSTSAWIPSLVELGCPIEKIVVSSIPSNIPAATLPESISVAKQMICKSSPIASPFIVGHFGSYGRLVGDLLNPILVKIAYELPDAVFALMGRGSLPYAAKIAQRYPVLKKRLFASGMVSPESAAALITACDCMVQPYADGANSRRTTLMACLINGRPTVSNDGQSCEPIWSEQKIVRLANSSSAEDVSSLVYELSKNDDLRKRLGRRAREYYWRHFALERTLDRLVENDFHYQ